MISTDVSLSDKLESCSEFAQGLFLRMIAHQDDWGRQIGAPAKVKVKLRPHCRKTVGAFEKAIRELALVGLICWYTNGKESYIALKTDSCADYQAGIHTLAVQRGRKSQFPAPPEPDFRWEEDAQEGNPRQSATVAVCRLEHNVSEVNVGEVSISSVSYETAGVREGQTYFFERLQKHTGLETPEFPWAQAGVFFKRRLKKGDTLEDFKATVDEFFDRYIRGKKSAANFGHYQRVFNALAIAVQEQAK